MKPQVRKSKAHSFWYIQYGPHLHQNMFGTWAAAYGEALKLNGGKRWH